jgi:hypothetical protein
VAHHDPGGGAHSRVLAGDLSIDRLGPAAGLPRDLSPPGADLLPVDRDGWCARDRAGSRDPCSTRVRLPGRGCSEGARHDRGVGGGGHSDSGHLRPGSRLRGGRGAVLAARARPVPGWGGPALDHAARDPRCRLRPSRAVRPHQSRHRPGPGVPHSRTGGPIRRGHHRGQGGHVASAVRSRHGLCTDGRRPPGPDHACRSRDRRRHRGGVHDRDLAGARVGSVSDRRTRICVDGVAVAVVRAHRCVWRAAAVRGVRSRGDPGPAPNPHHLGRLRGSDRRGRAVARDGRASRRRNADRGRNGDRDRRDLADQERDVPVAEEVSVGG